MKSGEGCPPEQIGTCEGCSNKECLGKLVSDGICLVHGIKGCDCTLVRDDNGHFTTQWVPRIYDEIQKWKLELRLRLILKLLQRECTHGDHPDHVKDSFWVTIDKLLVYEDEKQEEKNQEDNS